MGGGEGEGDEGGVRKYLFRVCSASQSAEGVPDLVAKSAQGRPAEWAHAILQGARGRDGAVSRGGRLARGRLNEWGVRDLREVIRKNHASDALGESLFTRAHTQK